MKRNIDYEALNILISHLCAVVDEGLYGDEKFTSPYYNRTRLDLYNKVTKGGEVIFDLPGSIEITVKVKDFGA